MPAQENTALPIAQRRSALKSFSAGLEEITHVPRVGPLEPSAFRAFAKGGIPFVVTGLVAEWVLSKMRPAQLIERFANLKVRARVGDYVEAAFSKNRKMIDLSFSEYIDLIKKDASELPPYLGNQSLPELTELCDWPAFFKTALKPKVWLGPANTITPLHCDYDDNLFAQMWGHKKFILYPPHHDGFLYTKEANPVLFGSPFDPESPDFDRMPMARRAKKVECIVRPGDLLFIPAGWFHHVRALEFSLSANCWTRELPFVLQS